MTTREELVDKELMLSQQRLKELLTYDPDTGVFTWLKRRGGTAAGTVAGCTTTDGHWRIRVDNRLYFAHRLAWFYVYGAFPSGLIDHKNGIPRDNRLSNLREADWTQNNANRPAYRNNKLGIKGVRKYSATKYNAQIKVHGKKISLGYFDSAGDAARAYQDAAIKYFGNYARFDAPDDPRAKYSITNRTE